MKNKKRSTYIHILLQFILPIFILGIIFLSLFRVHFLQIIHHDLSVLFPNIDQLNDIIKKGFAKGFRYDLIVISYIISIPLIILILSYLINIPTRIFIIFAKIYLIIAFAVLLLISFVDFSYFKYFWTHPTVTIFNWAGYGGTYGMLLQESSYYIYYLFYFICLALIIVACIYLPKWAVKTNSKLLENTIIQIGILTIASVFTFWGTKGQMSKKPIGMQPAYFTEAFLVSDLCFNAAYYFMSTVEYSETSVDDLMDAQEAIDFVKKEFKILDNSEYKNPISRLIERKTDKEEKKYNIVLVFMESISAGSLNQTIDNKKLTPFLDSLANVSYYFENFYSSGVHTNVGVASTLSSYPSRFEKRMMYRDPTSYKGMPIVLQKMGYTTSFFIPNEYEYDHMGFFLDVNGIDKLYVDKNYPKEEVVNMYGVPDKFLLQYALSEMNNDRKPFFTNILTVSNHPPYVVPQPFSDIWKDDELGILAYADHAIENFMREASKQDWYENTIFVFQGDHGKKLDTQIYSMALSYNHIPLIIYCPSFEDMPKRISSFGGQIDIFPTIMGLLNMEYINNTMGVDILNEERPYMFFSNDTHLACIDDRFLYIYQPMDKSEFLHEYKTRNTDNLINEYKEIANQMKQYALSMMVASDYLENNKLASEY